MIPCIAVESVKWTTPVFFKDGYTLMVLGTTLEVLKNYMVLG